MVEAAGAPLALFGRNLPVAALIPLTILWFGIDETQKVMFIFIACVPFVYSDTVAAIASVPERYVETAQTLGAIVAADRHEGAGAAGAAGHLQQPAAPLRPGVRLHHARRADQRGARARLPADDSQRRGLSEHIILILIIIGLLAYGIDRLLFWFQRGLFPYRAVED